MPVNEETILRVLLQDQPRLMGYIHSIVCDQHDADDVFQELSIHALRKRAEIVDEDHLAPWLRRVAKHKAIDLLRTRKRAPLAFDEALLSKLEADWEAVEHISTESMSQALHACVSKLSPYGARLIDLRYRDNLTGERLAEVLDRSVNTVNVALTRIRRALANCIRKQLGSEGDFRG